MMGLYALVRNEFKVVFNLCFRFVDEGSYLYFRGIIIKWLFLLLKKCKVLEVFRRFGRDWEDFCVL